MTVFLRFLFFFPLVGMSAKTTHTHMIHLIIAKEFRFSKEVARRLVWFWQQLIYLYLLPTPPPSSLYQIFGQIWQIDNKRTTWRSQTNHSRWDKEEDKSSSISFPPPYTFLSLNFCVLYNNNYALEGKTKTNLTHNMMMLLLLSLLHFAVNFTILTENT